jgi:beta-mannosidase
MNFGENRMKLDLTSRSWKVCGYRPNYWPLRKTADHAGHFQPDIQAMPAVIPGSAQTALRAAKKLADWSVGNDSLLSHWVEHFEWEFFTDLPAMKLAEGEQAILHCEGLDYSGTIGIDGAAVAPFRGALVRHDFDLTPYLKDGKAHKLSIVFDMPPEEQGQMGWTSNTHYFKPRYNFSWDWTPRFVPVGIWDKLWIEIGKPAPKVVKALTKLDGDLTTGTVEVYFENAGDAADVTVAIRKGKAMVETKTVSIGNGSQVVTLDELSIEAWYPNGYGKQPLYELTVTVAGAKKPETIDRRTIGFKRVQWLQNPGAPEGSHPYVCEVNGEPVFLQGVNWTPIRMDYHHVPDAEYKKRIDLYKEMGCTMLRVWGGAFLEREVFYDLCDRAGLLVWQEFPLSSSGIDNFAPVGSAAIDELKKISTDYIQRRAHHASKLLWCGGNELTTASQEPWTPLQADHPALSAMKEIVQREDPGTRFLPTSPSGKTFGASLESMGKGINSHVHGPWNHRGTWEEAVEYWSKDDSTFRSECGMPSTNSLKMFKKYAGKLPLWPATKDNPLWSHTTLWWLPKEQFEKELKGLKGEAALKKYIALSQAWQSKILCLAAEKCKGRFPKCSGFIIWMGHDCFPCPINTSLIDFDGNTKPVFEELKKIFRKKPAAARKGKPEVMISVKAKKAEAVAV